MGRRRLGALEVDREYRYAVAGLLGLGVVFKRLDRHEQRLIELRENLNMLKEDVLARP